MINKFINANENKEKFAINNHVTSFLDNYFIAGFEHKDSVFALGVLSAVFQVEDNKLGV